MPNDKKRLIDLDLNGNEIQNGVDQNLATAPSNPKEGQFYWNTATKKDMIFNGIDWVDRTNQGKVYSEGTGIDITGTVISIDDTVVATKDFVSNTYVPQTRTINTKPLSGNVTLNASDVGAVPTTRKINNKALSSDITLDSSDVGALANTTKYGATLSLNIDSTTYVMTATLKDQDGNTLGTAQTVDLPIESLVLDVDFDEDTNELIIKLQSGTETRVPLSSIIGGLQSEITSENPLDADLVDDTTSAHKFVTNAQRTQIGTNATNIGTIQTTIGGYGDIVTHNASEFATSAQGTKADTACQKFTATNPALTVSSGVCTWTITNTLANADVQVIIREVSSNQEVVAGVTTTASTITIKMNSASNIEANTYKAVIIG